MGEVKPYQNVNFQLVCAAGLMAMMTVSMIVPAFPKVVQKFSLTGQSIGLLITLSFLPSLILTPVGGMIADRLGRKKLMVPSLFLFGIFGGACAFAPDFNTLLILRALQGISGTPMMGVTGAIIGDLFSGQKRAEAMGEYTSILYGGYIVYPLAGGALAVLSWNYPFLCFLLAIPLGVLTLIFLRCPEPQTRQTLKEYLGSALHYMNSLKVLWIFSASVLTYVLLYGAFLTYFSLLLGGRFNASAFIIGLSISLLGFTTAISSSQAGRLSKRFTPVTIIKVAFGVYALALIIIPVSPNIWLCLVAALIFGIAHGLNLPCQSVIAAGITPLENRAGFMAISGSMMSLGMTVGPLIMGLIFSLTSLNTTFFIAALIALVIPAMAAIIGKGKLSN